MGPEWIGLRRLDRERGWTKGSAFRAFKRCRAQWIENRDYRVLHHAGDAAELAALKQSGEIYETSVNAVLLSPAAAARLIL